jgi:hypothetical protein
MKKIFTATLFFLLLSTTTTFASHILGGSITWECTATGQYQFTLTLYRDCTGVPLISTTETLTSNAGGNISCTKIATNYYNPECNAPSCSGATIPYQMAVEEHVYRSAPVTLTGSPPATGWFFSWNTCCRPSGVTNLVGSSGLSFTLRAYMYPYVPANGTQVNAANPCFDSSPKFLEKPRFVYCSGTQQTAQLGGSDADSDSTYVSLAAPLGSNLSNPLPYAVGYSSAQPLPASSNQSLNNTSGAFTFNSSTQGKFTVCTKISEWRDNQLIGEVFRDAIIAIKPCTPPPGICGGVANTPPTLTLGASAGFAMPLPVYDTNNVLSHYELTAGPGTQIQFNMASQDVDLQPSCTPQTITFSGQGTHLSVPPANCPAGINCATITSNNSGGSFTTTLNNVVQFNWTPTCASSSSSSAEGTYDFFFTFSDNACPLPGETSCLVRIKVVTPATQLISASNTVLCPGATITLSGAPNMTSYQWSTGSTSQNINVSQAGTYTLTATLGGCTFTEQIIIDTLNLYTQAPDICLVTIDTATGYNNLVWERPTKKGVAGYIIFRALGSGSFVPIDTVDANQLSIYEDLGSNQNNALHSYYIGLLDSCGGIGGSAVFTHSAPFLMASFNPANQVDLTWTHYMGRTPQYYIIYRSDFAGAPYAKLDSVLYPSFNYIDSNLPANTGYSYRLGAVMDSSCLPTAKANYNEAISNTATYQVFGTVEVDLVKNLLVYPNPSSGVFTFDTQLLGTFEVYNATGQRIKKGDVINDELSLLGFADGVYLLKITTEDGQTLVQRLVKN